jgi:hypothetical protein
MFTFGLIFLAVSAPFMLNYLSSHVQGPVKGGNYDLVYQIMKDNLIEGFFDLPHAILDFILRWHLEYFYWGLAFVGAGYLLIWAKKQREVLSMIGTWLIGLLFISIVIPLIDQSLARANNWIPMEFDLIRGVRYLIPFMLLFCIWPLSELFHRLKDRSFHPIILSGVCLLGLLIVAVWVAWHPLTELKSAAKCWIHGHLSCVQQSDKDLVDVLDAVRGNTAPGAKIMSTAFQLQIRFYAMRPVLYAPKDRGILAYSNPSALVEWYSRQQTFLKIENEADPATQMQMLLDFTNALDAKYLLIDSKYEQGLKSLKGGNVIWSNSKASLIRIIK